MHRGLPAHVELNDVIGAGRVGLVEASKRYDPTKGVTFGTFAQQRIRGAILDDLRRRDLLGRKARAEVTSGSRVFRELQLEHIIGRRRAEAGRWGRVKWSSMLDGHPWSDPSGSGIGAPHDRLVLVREVMTALRALPSVERRVLVWAYLWELSLVEIARRLGMSPGGVAAVRDRGVARLREAIAVRAERSGLENGKDGSSIT